MSDLWHKLKGVFVVEDTTSPVSSSNSTISQSNQTNSTGNSSTTLNAQTSIPVIDPVVLIGNNIGAGVNEKFMQVLFGALEKANLPGFDYLEYKQALGQLITMPMDEATRYKSAYAMAQTMGVTAEKLVNTALHYLDVLKQEEGKFNQTADAQRLNQIESRNANVKNLNDIVAQKEEQIRKLSAEIAGHKQQLQQTQTEIGQAETKMAQTKSDFSQAINTITSQIQMDITNMKNYLH